MQNDQIVKSRSCEITTTNISWSTVNYSYFVSLRFLIRYNQRISESINGRKLNQNLILNQYQPSLGKEMRVGETNDICGEGHTRFRLILFLDLSGEDVHQWWVDSGGQTDEF